MASVNKVILIGNLGADPELRYTTGGTPVAEMRLATNRKYKNRDGQMTEEVEWHRVVVWGKQGENVKEYLAKGRSVYVEGRLRTRKWEDRDGKPRYTTEVVADLVQFLGGRGGGGGGEYGEPPPPDDADAPAAPSDMGDDDIPF